MDETITAADVRLTLAEWSQLAGIRIIDPDGFDRTDPHLWERGFTLDEFERGIPHSTIYGRLLDIPVRMLAVRAAFYGDKFSEALASVTDAMHAIMERR